MESILGQQSATSPPPPPPPLNLDITSTSDLLGATNPSQLSELGSAITLMGDNNVLSSEQQQQQAAVQQQPSVVQKEAELKEMQNQIESFNQMVKQLTSQREMAVRKLAEMDQQIQELTKVLEVERIQVDAKDQELKSKRTKLQTLKNEEDELTTKFTRTKHELDSANENLNSTMVHENQINDKLVELKEFMSKTTSALDDIEKAITYKDTMRLSALCDNMLTAPTPLATNTLLTNGMRTTQEHSSHDTNQPASANFADQFAGTDPFEGSDPFESEDPFKAEELSVALPEDDPFNPISASSASTKTPVFDDPFGPSGF